ncbi:hypothetical protein R3J27_08275 [Xylella fastidiosa subsp. multiplex]
MDAGDPSKGIPPTMESDAAFRRRIVLAPEGYSVAGPEGAYIYHAISAPIPTCLTSAPLSPTPWRRHHHLELSRSANGWCPLTRRA